MEKTTLFEKIKQDKLLAFKEKDFEKSTILGTLLSELTRDLYNPSSPVEDKIVYSKINKFLENIKEVAAMNKLTAALEREMDILQSYLPKELSEPEMINILTQALVEGRALPNIKSLMSYFSDNYLGRFNGKTLVNLIETSLDKDAGLTKFGRLATSQDNK